MKPYSSKTIINFYWQEVKAYPRIVATLLIILPITILLNSFIPPLILANVLNHLSQHRFIPHAVWASFGKQIVLFAVIDLAGGLLGWRIVDRFVWRLEGNIERNLARKVFNTMLIQSADFHANSFSGSLVSQTTKLLSSYVRLADTTIFQVSQLVFGLVFAIALLAPRSPYYAFALFLFAIAYVVITFYVSKPVQQQGAHLSKIESKQTGYLADAITNVMAIKSFAGTAFENSQFASITDNTFHALHGLAKVQRRQLNVFSASLSVISTASLVFAIISVVTFNANIATVFLIFNYTSYVLGQLFQFGNSSLRTYNRALGDATDMINILAETPSILDPVKPEVLHISNGNIEFRKVDFTHNGAASKLFDGLNLSIKHGEKIGLVGHSGSGKTSFTRVLLRFSDIQGGEILIDGQNIAKITQEDLHGTIAYVPQEPLLFHRSISENIAYSKPDATTPEIETAANNAHATEFINTLPKGYKTLVGERGVKLSGGQRQRIAIARAMLKDAPILVLDEATSALDSESEVLIQDALWKLMQNRTALVIAHRLSTIQKMDRIIVLDNGIIIEQGSHTELLKLGGTYAKLWAHQSGGFIDE